MSAQQKPEPGTAVATRAKEQRGKMDIFRSRLDRLAPEMQRVLPRYLTPERVVALALTAATKNPALLECSVESVALAMMQLAQSGLELGRTGYLVPFKGTCTFIPSWQGLVQLILQSRHVKDVKARAVYKNEHFVYEEGLAQRLDHIVNSDPEKRGPIIGFYAIAFFARGGATFEYLSKQDVDKIRAGAPSKNSPAWNDHYVEMGKKTAIRRLAKRLPQSTAALTTAIEADAEFVDFAPNAFMSNQSSRAVEGGPQQSRLMISGAPDDPYMPNDSPPTSTDPVADDSGDEGEPASDDAADRLSVSLAYPMPFAIGDTKKLTPLADVSTKDLRAGIKFAGDLEKWQEAVAHMITVVESRGDGE